MAGAAGNRLQVVFAEHEGQAAGLQGLLERLEAIAVLDLDHVPRFLQQLLEAVPQRCAKAIDDCPHGVVDDRRCQQVQRAMQRPARQDYQPFEVRFQCLACGVAEGYLRLHQQGDAVAALGQYPDQVVLASLAATGGRPRQVRQCPENTHDRGPR